MIRNADLLRLLEGFNRLGSYKIAVFNVNLSIGKNCDSLRRAYEAYSKTLNALLIDSIEKDGGEIPKQEVEYYFEKADVRKEYILKNFTR